MSDDVLITPASRKVEFFDSGGNIDGKIELSAAGDLNITSTGKITIGDITQDIHIGDGTQAVDLVFDFASSIYSVANQDLTIGKGSLGGNDVIIDGAGAVLLSLAGTEQARLTSTGLGIGTTSPSSILHVKEASTINSVANSARMIVAANGGDSYIQLMESTDGHNIRHTASDNSLRFRSTLAGSDLMTLTSGGNLGIGTTSPAATLHVDKGSTVAPSLTFGATAGQIFQNENSEFAFGLDNDSPYSLWIQGRNSGNAARDISLQPLGGKIGIGTESPNRLVEIQESGTGAAYLRLSNTNTSYPNDTVFGGIEFYNADSSGPGVAATIHALSNGSGRGGYLQFGTDATGSGSPTTRMTIDENGLVGIGTTSPSAPLHITSADTASEAFRVDITDTDSTADSTPFVIDGDGRVGIGTASPVAGSALTLNGDGTTYEGIAFQSGGSTKWKMSSDGSAWYHDSQVNTLDYNIRLRDSTGAYQIFHMNADTAGTLKVGIGVTAPTDTLAVSGGIKIGEFNSTDGTGYAGTSPPSDHNNATGASDPQLRVSGRTSDAPGIIQMAFFDANNFFGGTGEFVLGKLQYAMNENSNTVTTVAEIRGITSDPQTAGNFDGALKFLTSQGDASSANLTEKMILTSDGYLGIGTDSPVPMLHIYGDNTTTNQTTSGAASITIENDGTGDVAVNYLLTGIRRWITGIDNSDDDKFKISTGGTDIGTGAKLAIDTSGNAVIAGDVQAASATITGLMTSGTANINSGHLFDANTAHGITTNGVAIGSGTTKVRAESGTFAFSQSYTLVSSLNNGTELELFRFNVANASYRKFQAGRMYIRVQVQTPQSGGSGFFQQTVTFGDDASGGAAQSTTDRIDSSMTGGNAAYDHEKATIVVSRVSDYICVKFRNDTGVAILATTSSGFQAQLSCELFELDAMPS